MRTRRYPAAEDLGQLGALVAACTLVLTASFLGAVSLATGAGEPFVRLPAYVLVAAVAFVGGVVLFEESQTDGGTVLVSAGALAGVTFVLVSLTVEGVAFAAADPASALESRLLGYLLAASLAGTGLGYWGLRHWRELARRATPGGL